MVKVSRHRTQLLTWILFATLTFFKQESALSQEPPSTQSDASEPILDPTEFLDSSAGASKEQQDDSKTKMPTRHDDKAYKHAVTSYSRRVSFDFGDQAGGPVRYNTRFPTVSDGQNPASYYHTQAHGGIYLESFFKRGGLQLGLLTRRDFAHRGILGREESIGGTKWTVDQFNFHSDAVNVGWIFGAPYREVPWKSSLSLVFDRSVLMGTLANQTTKETRRVDVVMLALSLRGQLLFRVFGKETWDLLVGPDIHLPVYSTKQLPEEETMERSFADLADVKNTAAVGVAASIGYML
jgi:hypothetical protein